LHRKSPPNNERLMLWDEVMDEFGQEHLVAAAVPKRALGYRSDEPDKFDLLKQFESERSRSESQRLLYVAVTRAKRRLHLLGSVKPDSKSETLAVKPPAKGSLLSLMWHVAEPAFQDAYATSSTKSCDAQPRQLQRIDVGQFNHLLVRIKQAGRPESLPSQMAFGKTPQANDLPAARDQHADEVDGGIAADVGTLIHRYLEVIASEGIDVWTVQRVKELAPFMRRWLRQRGHSSAVAEDAALQVVAHVTQTLSCELGRWVLGTHEDAANELSVTTEQGGRMQTHVIDRTFVENGVRWVIDYKTTQQANQDELLSQHYSQLARYRSLFGNEESVVCALYLTASNEMLELINDR
jgi:ATP-dependent helicase/nuclease subunit A